MATLIVGLFVKYTIGLRIDEEDEVEGIDFIEHGESAYELSGAGARRPSSLSGSVATAPATSTKEGANA